MLAYADSESECQPLGCGWATGEDWEGELGVGIFDLDLGKDGGDSCQLVMPDCTGGCSDAYAACLAAGEAASDCLAALEACIAGGSDAPPEEETEEEDRCGDLYSLCTQQADLDRDACYGITPEADWTEVCDVPWAEAISDCDCEQRVCTGEAEASECVDPPAVPLLIGPGRYRLERRLIDAQVRDLGALAADVSASQILDGEGVLRGVRLASIEEGDVLHRMGLRDGDVILAVNGRPARQLMADLGAARALLDAREWRVALERRSASRVLTYRIVD